MNGLIPCFFLYGKSGHDRSVMTVFALLRLQFFMSHADACLIVNLRIGVDKLPCADLEDKGAIFEWIDQDFFASIGQWNWPYAQTFRRLGHVMAFYGTWHMRRCMPPCSPRKDRRQCIVRSSRVCRLQHYPYYYSLTAPSSHSLVSSPPSRLFVRPRPHPHQYKIAAMSRRKGTDFGKHGRRQNHPRNWH